MLCGKGCLVYKTLFACSQPMLSPSVCSPTSPDCVCADVGAVYHLLTFLLTICCIR